MAQFAKLSIFGTVFEVTTRYVARHDLTLDMAQEKKKIEMHLLTRTLVSHLILLAMLISSPSAWVPLVSSGKWQTIFVDIQEQADF